MEKNRIVATWNKAEEKLRLLADIERQIVNASIENNPIMWVKLLKSYLMMAQTYFKDKTYLDKIINIEKTLSNFDKNLPVNVIMQQNLTKLNTTEHDLTQLNLI